MGKKLTLEEEHTLRLEMLKCIDSFCRSHGLKYQLAYGTLLGAIRHKGFIPWDDDADILMPLPDMLKFRDLFNSDKYMYCDVDTWKHYDFGFSRFIHKDTINKIGLFTQEYGVFIDIYPVTGVPLDKEERELFFEKAEELRKKRIKKRNTRRRLMKLTPFKSFPGFDLAMRKFRDLALFTYPYESAKCYLHYGGPFRDTDVYEYDVFENMIEVEFEGYKMMAPAEYHDILTRNYDDYMQYPPEEERHPYHGSNIYWK